MGFPGTFRLATSDKVCTKRTPSATGGRGKPSGYFLVAFLFGAGGGGGGGESSAIRSFAFAAAFAFG
jgi:hypothetical protein